MEQTTSRNDAFLNKYKELESIAKSTYGITYAQEHQWFACLKKKLTNPTLRNNLDFCREVRNLLQHNPKVDGEYAVEVSAAMLNLLDDLVEKLSGPATAGGLCTRKVFYKRLEDKVVTTLNQMQSNGKNNVPVVKDGVVLGIFNKSVVLSCISDGLMIDDSLKMADIQKYLEKEMTVGYIASTASREEAVECFQEAIRNKRHVEILIVTQNGNSNEKMIGVITMMDVLSVSM